MKWINENGGFQFTEEDRENAKRLKEDPAYTKEWNRISTNRIRAGANRINFNYKNG
jgi:hypothetical protein